MLIKVRVRSANGEPRFVEGCKAVLMIDDGWRLLANLRCFVITPHCRTLALGPPIVQVQ